MNKKPVSELITIQEINEATNQFVRRHFIAFVKALAANGTIAQEGDIDSVVLNMRVPVVGGDEAEKEAD